MIILGIDPGSITTGYAFLDTGSKNSRVLEYGVLHAPAGHALEDRLLQIVSELETLLDKYHPEALSMEGVFFAKNAKSALVLGHIRGAVLVACRRRGMSFNEYSPRAVKLAVTHYTLKRANPTQNGAQTLHCNGAQFYLGALLSRIRGRERKTRGRERKIRGRERKI